MNANKLNGTEVKGIIRKMDVLGRVVIPNEIRRYLSIDEGTCMEITYDDSGTIYINKAESDTK